MSSLVQGNACFLYSRGRWLIFSTIDGLRITVRETRIGSASRLRKRWTRGALPNLDTGLQRAEQFLVGGTGGRWKFREYLNALRMKVGGCGGCADGVIYVDLPMSARRFQHC